MEEGHPAEIFILKKNSENASLSHLVVRGPGYNLLQNVGIHIWQGDNFLVLVLTFISIESTKIAYIVVHAKILQHGLDGHRLLCNLKQFDMCCRFSAEV